MQLIPIATARNGFTDKFGIPRQPADLDALETRIVFAPAFRVPDALRGIEGFSHLWLIWQFSRTPQANQAPDPLHPRWSPTVRPPRLGGNTRMGVFATRSPFRPNPLGLSAVRLLRIEQTPREGTVLVVAGADLLDGTPIYDIKPYLAYSDSHPDARCGFVDTLPAHRLSVHIAPELLDTARRQGCPWDAIRAILAQDPRPAYQHDPNRLYRLDYDGWNVSFTVQDTPTATDTPPDLHSAAPSLRVHTLTPGPPR